VEGPVTDYANSGRSVESFSVNGHPFSYSDYVVTSGFHTTAAHAGQFAKVFTFGLPMRTD
jgi:hypothetical protein